MTNNDQPWTEIIVTVSGHYLVHAGSYFTSMWTVLKMFGFPVSMKSADIENPNDGRRFKITVKEIIDGT